MSVTPFKQPGDVLWDDPVVITYEMLLTNQLNYTINDFLLILNSFICIFFVVTSPQCVEYTFTYILLQTHHYLNAFKIHPSQKWPIWRSHLALRPRP